MTLIDSDDLRPPLGSVNRKIKFDNDNVIVIVFGIAWYRTYHDDTVL